MKMQPRILPLCCAQCQDDSAKGEGDAAYFHSSHTCRFAPPNAMKMQPRILPLRCAQCQDDSAKGEGDAAYFHSRSFDSGALRGPSLRMTNQRTRSAH